MVVSERVTLGILSDSDFNSGGIFGGQGEALPSSIIKKQRKAATSRESDSVLAALNKASDKKSAAAIVKKSEFNKLQNKVNANEKFLVQFSQGKDLIQGAAGLATPNGILGAGLGASRAIPGIGIAITIAKVLADKYVAQFGAGGTKDNRKKVLAEDVSNIGVENETDIASGRKLFLSNPFNNQGVPRGPSNTEDLRDGIRIYNLRQEGSYQ